MKKKSFIALIPIAVLLTTVAHSAETTVLQSTTQPTAQQPVLPQSGQPVSYPTQGLSMIVATSSTEAQEHVIQGISCLLTFWDDAARHEFTQALRLDPTCLMAHWGIVMSSLEHFQESDAAIKEAMQHLELQLETQELPARELAYAEALMTLLREGAPQAAQRFIDISKRWKRDPWAPLFAVLMLHDGFQADGAPKPGQQQAESLLTSYLNAHPDVPAARFIQAFLQETAPKLPATLEDTVSQTLALMPHYPPTLHMAGHFQFRLGQYTQAEQSFAKAIRGYEQWQQQAQLSPADNEGYWKSRSYQVVSQFCAGNEQEAIQEARDLAQQPIDPNRLTASGTQMQLWEIRSLPMRLTFAQYPWQEYRLFRSHRDSQSASDSLSNCLQTICFQALQGRKAIVRNDYKSMVKALDKLEEQLKLLEEERPTAEVEGALSHWQRSRELASRMLLELRSEMHPDSAGIWLDDARSRQQFSSMLMPPILPYPVEWKLARLQARQNDWQHCRQSCQQGLERFPGHRHLNQQLDIANKHLTTTSMALVAPPNTQPSTQSTQQTPMQEESHPFLDPSFLVPWSQLTPDHIKPDMEFAMREAQRQLDAIANQPLDQLSYESTFGALEHATESLQTGWGRLMHLDSVMDNPAQRAAIAETLPDVSRFLASISLQPALWHVLKEASQRPWVKDLSPDQVRFIEETLADFRESGADLSDSDKKRFAEIEAQLTALTKKFAENVLDSTNQWEYFEDDPQELAGLPESIKEAARLDAKAKGHGTDEHPVWRFTQQYTSYGPVMKFAESDKLRRTVWEGMSTIGTGQYDNEGLIDQIIKLRHEKAQLLGYKTFADYTTARRMAKTGDNALHFINDLHDKVQQGYLEDMKSLLEYRNAKTGQKGDQLHPWETSFWAEKRRQELFQFNEEDLRPYYSVDKVMQGMFAIYSHLYGFNVTQRPTVYLANGRQRTAEEIDSVEVWHPDVLFYDITDAATGEHLGSFYADWHPRPSKRGGAWMNCLSVGLPPMNGRPRVPHLGLVCGNMTKPIGDKPALLSHLEVETIFHEFGHLLHQLLSNTEVKSLAGTNVAWDFVELPSQINENWCWERESVNKYAFHYQTGAPIPDDLFNKMKAARNYMSATDFMRQLTFGKLDLELHIHPEKYLGRSIEEVDQEILHDYRVPMSCQGTSVARRLTHLFSDPTGYAAGYYSYKWAEVLAADAFTRFLKEGILNEKTGRSFRDTILSRGNSQPADVLYRNFMGRDPDAKALLIKSGIHQD